MANFDHLAFDPTAFMSGQTLSKRWLSKWLGIHYRTRYDNSFPEPQTVWVLAGWYALTNLILRENTEVPIKHVTSFDIDPEATKRALILNEAYHWLGEFRAETADVSDLDYTLAPDLVINTAVEHMETRKWWDDIPKGTLVALQSNDMPHDVEVTNVSSEEEFADLYPMSQQTFIGNLPFDYGEWSFKRFMVIGIK